LDLVETVDSLISDRVLVFGSIPPVGRDLDLLVRPAELAALERGLPAHGFVRGGRKWARFRSCSAEVVDLVPAAEWDLPRAELETLLFAAEPVAGAQRVARLAAHHAAAIAAARSDGVSDRGRALLRSLLPHRGALISLSGLDGAGKSRQANALAETLDRLGYEVRVEWMSVAPPRWLDRVGRLAKATIRPLASRARSRSAATDSPQPDPARELRRRSPALTFMWAWAVSLRFGLRGALALRAHMLRGRVVICDRYVLDAWTYLRYHYGVTPSVRPHLRLLRLLCPTPRKAFLLDVAPDVASSRKDDFSPSENAQRAAFYEERRHELRAERLDGMRPVEEVCAEVAAATWTALRQPRPARRRKRP